MPLESSPAQIFGEAAPLRRLGVLAILLALEWIPLSAVIHTERGGASVARFIIAFVSFFLALGYFRARGAGWRISSALTSAPVGWSFLAAHLCTLSMFIGMSMLSMSLNRAAGIAVGALWFGCGGLSLCLMILAFVPPRLCLAFLRRTGNVAFYALAGAATAWRLTTFSWSVWDSTLLNPVTDLTFRLVRILLRLFVSQVIADPSRRVLGTPRFTAIVGAQCSGIEGLGLMLVFSVAWLWFFRREIRFPRALLLIPAGLSIMWMLNAVRITALLLIGNAGAENIALGGFHSQAGWIAFSGITLAFAASARYVPWFAAGELRANRNRVLMNPTAIYLAPFLTILAASLLTHAASDGFEWLYPLRFLAAAAALWFLRSQYRPLDWRFDWIAVAGGAAIFAIWIALDRLTSGSAAASIPSALADARPAVRISWIALRTLAAVTTVPIAEELAFRGFLIRRMISADFESVSLRRYNWFAVLVSSLLFGLLHGNRWLAGTISGIAYALIVTRKGRIGDAVVAHAVTNALLAAYVLSFQRWQLW